MPTRLGRGLLMLLGGIIVLCAAGAWTSGHLLKLHDDVWDSEDGSDRGLFSRLCSGGAQHNDAAHSPGHPCYPLYSRCTADADCCAGLRCLMMTGTQCCKDTGQSCVVGMECCNMCMMGACT